MSDAGFSRHQLSEAKRLFLEALVPKDLLELYAAAVLVRGEECLPEHIYEAYMIYTGKEDYPRFSELPEALQHYDVPFQKAVIVAAREMKKLKLL